MKKYLLYTWEIHNMDTVPIVDGERFIPDMASYLYSEKRTNGYEREDGRNLVKFTAEDDNGEKLSLEYQLSYINASIASYENPEEADMTTEPEEIENKTVYVPSKDSHVREISFENPSNPVSEVWEKSDYVEFEEDYIVIRGLDNTEPVPHQYEAYYVLTLCETEDGETVYKHKKL